MNKLLIAALSCEQYESRRQRCLATWIPEARRLGVDVVLVVGSPTATRARRDGQMLIVPTPNDVASQPHRVRELCRWALRETNCEYLFKCDDDTYVRVDRLLSVGMTGRDYLGTEWAANDGYANGGAGYLLSRRALEIVAEQLPESTCAPTRTDAEDVLVGRCLKQAGIALCVDRRFIPFASAERRPRPDNDLITGHASAAPWLAHRVEFEGATPIVTCRPQGRLGNVLFQVAAAVAFSLRHRTHAAVFDAGSLGPYRQNILRRLTTGDIPGDTANATDAGDFTYRPIPHNPSVSVAICGYMQSERYFLDCREVICELFQPKVADREYLIGKYGALLGPHTVSLHVRRGDYVAKQEYHPLQPPEYYRQALSYLEERTPIAHILCFADDLPWCRENLAFDARMHLIEGEREHLDLALMAMCAHHIIANSSFSWWGAWLNPSAEKIVVAPARWFGPGYASFSDHDLVPPEWVRLPREGIVPAPVPAVEQGSPLGPQSEGHRELAKAPGFPRGMTPAEIRRMVGRDDPVVLELGCHDGSDTIRFLEEFPAIRLYCFEPDPRPVPRFRRRIADPRCQLDEIAIGARDGKGTLYLSGGRPSVDHKDEWDLSSSIRPATGHLSAHPWCTFKQTCSVQVRALDSWLREHPEIGIIDFLWADIQGAECDLLAGGLKALESRTRYLYTEFYQQPMYDGQISGNEILERLPSFECLAVFEGYNMLLRNSRLSLAAGDVHWRSGTHQPVVVQATE